MKKAVPILITFAFLLGLAVASSAKSYRQREDRAVAMLLKGPSQFSLTVIHVKTTGGSAAGEDWVVSGFAPGVGSFSQSVPRAAVDIKFNNGTASVNTIVHTSQGEDVTVSITWQATSGTTTKNKRFTNPSNIENKYNSNRASVSGSIGGFTIGDAIGEISERETRIEDDDDD